MFDRKIKLVALAVVAAVGLVLAFSARQIQAVPSLPRQTGMDCPACHTVSPKLTPFGRKSKLIDYTISKHANKVYKWAAPNGHWQRQL